MKYEVLKDRLWDPQAKPLYTTNDYIAAKTEAHRIGGKVRKKLEAGTFVKHQAEVYCYRFKGEGWAHYTICEATGEFSIQSDWGDYSYMWPKNNRGTETLKEFLISANSCYITEKFSYSKHREFREEFSGEDTVEEIKEMICRARLEEDLDKDKARELWDIVKKMELTTYTDSREFHDALHEDGYYQPCNSKPLLDFIGEDFFYESLRYRHSQRYEFCQNSLVPFFQEVLRKELNENSGQKKTD